MKRLFIAAVVLPLVAIFLFVTVQPLKVLPRIAPAPAYSLTDQAEARLTSEMVRGEVVIYSFAPVGCEGDGCPPTLATLRDLQRELQGRPDLPDVRVVIVGVDEAAQEGAARAEAARRWGGEAGDWSVISGAPERVKLLVGEGFRTYYTTKADGSTQVTPAMILVDRLGIIRAEYMTRIPPMKTVLRDLDVLASEARNSQGMARYAYEAAHLFQCYAR